MWCVVNRVQVKFCKSSTQEKTAQKPNNNTTSFSIVPGSPISGYCYEVEVKKKKGKRLKRERKRNELSIYGVRCSARGAEGEGSDSVPPRS